MRKKKNADRRLKACGALVFMSPDTLQRAGGWQSVFGGDKPVHLEIGCGKGAFAVGTAERNPDVNLVALERNIDVFTMAAERALHSGLANIRLVLGDANQLEAWFTPGQISRIYLNFSDPWPKSRHEKRRLTHENYLRIYRRILAPKGGIIFKTDNAGLFDFSLQAFADFGLEVTDITYDLHSDIGADDNIMTEYESRFTELGFPIHRCTAAFCAFADTRGGAPDTGRPGALCAK